jgi:hypothetical protein
LYAKNYIHSIFFGINGAVNGMNLYIWKHKGAIREANFYPLSKAEAVGENGLRGIACHAFFRKKDAIQYINSNGWGDHAKKYYELLKVEVK